MSKVKVTAPVISEETKREILKFFLRTSVPRILEEERRKKEKLLAGNEK